MSDKNRVVLIYKRTHTGDPSSSGIFGESDCMGEIREWKFTDVIGIGGEAPWKGYEEISYKVNWIGIGAKKVELIENRANEVIFNNFCLFDKQGELIKDIAPNLYQYMYLENKSKNIRSVYSTSLPKKAQDEVFEILDKAKNCPPSQGIVDGNKKGSCASKNKIKKEKNICQRSKCKN